MVTEVLNLSEALPRGPRTRGGTKVPQAGRKGSVIVIWAFNVTLYSKAPGARNCSSYKRKKEVKGVRVLALACTAFPPNAYVEALAPSVTAFGGGALMMGSAPLQGDRGELAERGHREGESNPAPGTARRDSCVFTPPSPPYLVIGTLRGPRQFLFQNLDNVHKSL